jgi:hypothetical protein
MNPLPRWGTTMAYDLKHAIVVERARKAIHVIRIEGDLIDQAEVAELARQHLLTKYGKQDADVGRRRKTSGCSGHRRRYRVLARRSSMPR